MKRKLTIFIILFNIKICNFIGLHPMLVYIATLWLVGLLYIKIHNHFLRPRMRLAGQNKSCGNLVWF